MRNTECHDLIITVGMYILTLIFESLPSAIAVHGFLASVSVVGFIIEMNEHTFDGRQLALPCCISYNLPAPQVS